MSSADTRYQYRGDLAETALPEMLYTIHRFQVEGVIEAERAGVVKRVHIKEGNVVHASSTDREDSLGTYLLRAGMLDPEQYAATMVEREHVDRRYGEILIDSGLLSPAEVYQAIREHVEAIVWSLFYWQDGAVRFDIGEPAGEDGRVAMQLPMRQVVLHGIKRAPNAKQLVSRLGRRETVFEPDFETEHLIGLALDADDYRLLRMVDGKRTLYQICDHGPLSAADNAKLMYAFQVLRLIRKAAVVENAADAEPATEAAERPPEPVEAAPGRTKADKPKPDEREPAKPAAEEPAAEQKPKRESGGVKIRFKTGGDRFG